MPYHPFERAGQAAIWLAVGVVVACGGRAVETNLDPKANPPPEQPPGADAGAQANPDAAVSETDTGAPDATSGDAGSSDAPSAEAASSDPDWDAGPKSCADVGKFPGEAACCQGEYCSGHCWTPSGGCSCGATLGGCIWPAVCCAGLCVGPCNSNCGGEAKCN